MAVAEISKRPPPPDYMVKGAARMCPAVLGWRNIKVLRGRKDSLGMEISIGGFLIISEIIFMTECTWSMILETDTKHGRKILTKKGVSGRTIILTLPSHHRVLLTSVNSNYSTNFRL